MCKTTSTIRIFLNPRLIYGMQYSPVGLKEAALDSPTFRATTIHFSEQVDIVEKWLDSYVKSIIKLSSEVSTLESLVNGFLAHTVPPAHLSEAVMDHDYTLLAMKRYGEGAKDFWSLTISALKRMDSTMVEPIRTFFQNDLRGFKVAIDTWPPRFNWLMMSRTLVASLNNRKDNSTTFSSGILRNLRQRKLPLCERTPSNFTKPANHTSKHQWTFLLSRLN